ncbi:MAG: sulfotransferase [Anaerolineales bacterium]|jgi:hypothetical protein
MALVIAGHARSGTTLLAQLFNLHPEIQVTIEFQNFRALNVGYLEHVRALRKNWYYRAYVGRTGREVPLRAKLPSAAFLAQYLLGLLPNAGGPIGVREVERVLHAIFPQARIVGDKYPRYIFRLDDLAREPGLQILVIYRDARDVVSSTLKQVRTVWRNRPLWKDVHTAAQVAQDWVRAIQAMERHRAQAYCIRYEDLVRNPDRELSALGEWLGVDPRGFSTQRVHEASIGKYQMGLSAEEADQVLEIAGPTLKTLGYL